jgi:SAM-dependent methyltransferase
VDRHGARPGPGRGGLAVSPGAHDDPLERGSREHYDDAAYYDHTYARRASDVAFYRDAARRLGSPVLELGVGSGRVAIPTALDGAEVLGLDLNAAMLARARETARRKGVPRGRLSLRRGDMRRFKLGRTFPLITAPFNALLHLYEPDDIAACFRCVRDHLAPGGRFVFDVHVPSPSELARDPERAYVGRPLKHPTLGVRVRYTERFRYDPIKQVQHITIRFEPEDGSPAQETLLTQRQIFPGELRALLTLGGLRLARRLGSFEGAPLGPDDAVQIIEAVALEPAR